MKQTVEVKMVKLVDVTLNPKVDWNEVVKEFSGYMFEIDDVDDIIKFIATQLAAHGEQSFIEGIGPVESDYVSFNDNPEIMALYRIEFVEEEVEFLT